MAFEYLPKMCGLAEEQVQGKGFLVMAKEEVDVGKELLRAALDAAL